MISVCIPIYNCDVRKLVTELHRQTESLPGFFELLLIDDASEEFYRKKNRNLSSLKNVVYEELPGNIGRSAIRNLLAKKARSRYLLFMDCDAETDNTRFIENYLSYCRPGIVCCGGRKNTESSPGREYMLRWYYSVKREEVPAAIRNKNPNKSFLTFNFLIDKQLFDHLSFDEKIKGYGHEDTLFGIELSEFGIKIEHIDNPLVNTNLDTTEVYIQKTEQSIRNLPEIRERIENKKAFTDSVKLVRMGQKISDWKLTSFVAFFFRISRKRLVAQLNSRHPNLLLFDLYKLGYFCWLETDQTVEK